MLLNLGLSIDGSYTNYELISPEFCCGRKYLNLRLLGLRLKKLPLEDIVMVTQRIRNKPKYEHTDTKNFD